MHIYTRVPAWCSLRTLFQTFDFVPKPLNHRSPRISALSGDLGILTRLTFNTHNPTSSYATFVGQPSPLLRT